MDRYWATRKRRKTILAEGNILLCLDSAMMVFPHFGLNGNYELFAPSIQSNIQFVDFDLSDTFNVRSQVVLK